MPKKTKESEEKEEVYPAKEQWKTGKKAPSEKKFEMDIGEREEEVYGEQGREKLVEDDELEPWEEGFMEGAEQRGELAKCAYCGKILGQSKKNTVEKKINGEIFLFCSADHAAKGKSKSRID